MITHKYHFHRSDNYYFSWIKGNVFEDSACVLESNVLGWFIKMEGLLNYSIKVWWCYFHPTSHQRELCYSHPKKRPPLRQESHVYQTKLTPKILPIEINSGDYSSAKSDVPRPGFFFPTGNPKPEHSGSGKPDRFDRLPVETGQIQIWIQKTQFNRFVPVYRSVWPVYRPVWPVYRPVWPVWIQIQI